MAVAVRPEPSGESGGDANEAGRLFEAYSERLLRYCLHVLRDRGEAEDAVQTTFLYAQRALRRGVVPESEYAWLHAIAKNVCRWQQRTAARRRRGITDADVSAIADREHDDDVHDLAQGLNEALASMPEGQRRALLLREWQGLSSNEVATQLGMSAPATYALLTRARRSLARAMASRPALGLNLGTVLVKLKSFFTGGVASATATTAVVAGLAVGGVTVGKRIQEARADSESPPAAVAPGADARDVPAPRSRVVARGALRPESGARSGAGRAARRPVGGQTTSASDALPGATTTAASEPASSADGSAPTPPTAGSEAPGEPRSERAEETPITADPPELPPPPEIELPDLPIVGDLPIVSDLSVVGDLLPSGDDDQEQEGTITEPVEDVVEGLPEVPVPELPPLLP